MCYAYVFAGCTALAGQWLHTLAFSNRSSLCLFLYKAIAYDKSAAMHEDLYCTARTCKVIILRCAHVFG